jgi:hypothetical protein
MFGIYHRAPQSLMRLSKTKKTRNSAIRYASEGALNCPGLFVVVDWTSGKEIFECKGVHQ